MRKIFRRSQTRSAVPAPARSDAPKELKLPWLACGSNDCLLPVHGVHACLNEQGVLDGASHPEWQSNVYHWYSETKRHPSLTRRGIMRKKLVGPHPVSQGGESDKGWLNIEQIATVEVTSEDPGFPIESAFGFEDGPGWRASQGGEQQIRVIFDNPVSVHRVGLRFHEPDRERTQEFILRWYSKSRSSPTEIVRQQWNFSPTGSTTEIEHYVVDLDEVSVLELTIRPDLHRPEVVATLAAWRVG